MTKYILVSIIAITITAGVFVILKEERDKTQLRALVATRTTELQKAKLDIGRAETKLGNANAMISSLSNQVQEEMKQRQAVLKLYAELEGEYQATKDKVEIVTRIVYKDKEIPIPSGKMFIKLDDGSFSEVSSLVFSYRDFRLDIVGDAIRQSLSYKLHQRFRGVFVESEMPGGDNNHYAEIFEVDDKGKDVGRIELTNFKVIKAKEAVARMYWLNPKIDLSVGYSYSPAAHNWIAGLGFSLSSYGVTPDDNTWRFFRLGLGITPGDAYLDFSPCLYNIAKHIPLVSNLWLTPSVGYLFNSKSWETSLGISVVF